MGEKVNSKRILVSIITPVLNGADYLEESLLSVLNQSYENIEHVFIDGGSTDGTLEIIKKYKKKYPGRIRFISEPDNSTGEAWNKGMKISKGDILGWLGSDDIYMPDAIASVVDFFHKNKEAKFVFGDAVIINTDGKVVDKYYTREYDISALINGINFIPTTSAFYKREVVERVGSMDTSNIGKWVGDLDYWIRVGKVYEVYRIKKVLSKFRVHERSIGGSKKSIDAYARGGFLINRRYGGSIFSVIGIRYILVCKLKMSWALPVIIPVYKFLKRKFLISK